MLRDGEVVLSKPTVDTNHDQLVDAMVGRTTDHSLEEHHVRLERSVNRDTEPVVRVRNLAAVIVDDVSFDARPGEIVGFAGIVGSGTSEVARLVAGAESRRTGTIELYGKVMPKRWSPQAAIDHGVCFVPQDRHAEGGVLSLSLADNIVLPRYSQYWRKKVQERRDIAHVVDDLQVHPRDSGRTFAEFSGGNQQKALLGKWLLLKPRVLVLDDPTYGVDPNARETLLHAIAEVADSGAAVIVISTEPEQLARICDRVLVMHSGHISEELTGGRHQRGGHQPCLLPLNSRDPRVNVLDVARRYVMKYSLVVILVFLIILYSILQPSNFPTTDNFKSILLQQTVPVVIALAALIPIIAGGFDLSIGYVLGFSSVVAASVGAGSFGNGFTAITIALLAGARCRARQRLLRRRLGDELVHRHPRRRHRPERRDGGHQRRIEPLRGHPAGHRSDLDDEDPRAQLGRLDRSGADLAGLLPPRRMRRSGARCTPSAATSGSPGSAASMSRR